MRKDVVDRCLRQLSRFCKNYPVAMQIITASVIGFAKDGIDDFACGDFTERDIDVHSFQLVADFHELGIKGLLYTFGSFHNEDNEIEYQFTVNEVFCRVIKNSVIIESNSHGYNILTLNLPYRNQDLRISEPNKWEHSR